MSGDEDGGMEEGRFYGQGEKMRRRGRQGKRRKRKEREGKEGKEVEKVEEVVGWVRRRQSLKKSWSSVGMLFGMFLQNLLEVAWISP